MALFFHVSFLFLSKRESILWDFKDVIEISKEFFFIDGDRSYYT